MEETSGVFHRGFWSRFLHYLYLLPLLLGFRPLIIRFDGTVFIIYSLGFLILLLLIIFSNHIPYITYDNEALKVMLEYREDREIHRFDEMLGYYRSRSSRIYLFSLEHKPLKLRMGPKLMDRFVQLLQEHDIQPIEKEVAFGKK